MVTNDQKTYDVFENTKQNEDPLKINSDLEMNNSFDTHISENTLKKIKQKLKIILKTRILLYLKL